MSEENKVKIFIVDDNEFSRKTISKILGDAGYLVMGDNDGLSIESVVESMGREHINLLICDIVMPNMTGIEMVKKLKGLFKDLYVIMISSLTSENIVMESIAAGASDFIRKPFEPETLLESVQKVSLEIKQSE